ncbi:MAG: transporter [Acidimicrobiia bacterium]|nr:transporter [Acidimicrobiia bacterium]
MGATGGKAPNRGTLHVLKHRDFRLIAVGNMVSQMGFWAQYVAVGLAARSLTDSSFLIASAFSAQFWPSLLFSPFAGVLADRYDRRRLVMFGNLAMVIPPLALGLMAQSGHLNITTLIILVFFGGAGLAFSQPATVAFIPALVPPEDLHAAIALNSGMTSSTRVIGPSIAGGVITAWGVGWGFHVNAISFLAVTMACAAVRIRPAKQPVSSVGILGQLRSGAAYSRSNPAVFRLIMFAGVQSFFMMQAALMPIFATDVLHGGKQTYGWLSAAPGAGFLLGTMAATMLRSEAQRRIALVTSSVAMGVAFLVIGVSRSVIVTVGALGLFGLGFFVMNTLVTAMLISASDDEYRGRVMGVFSTLTTGIVSVNSLVAGAAAGVLGAPLTVGLCGVTLLSFLVLFCVTGGMSAVKTAMAPRAIASSVAPGNL